MCGRHDNSKGLLNQLINHAKTDMDRAECLAEQAISLSSIGSFLEAIETANRGLAYFGKAIPQSQEEADRQRKILMTRINASEDIWQTILIMPLTEDRQSKIEFAYYSELIPNYYLCGRLSQLYLTAAQATLRCLSTGMDEAVIYSLAGIGLHLAEEEEFEQAFKYENLVRDLAEKYPNTFGSARGMNAIVWVLMHSRSHPQEIVDYCLKSIQCGKNCGDQFTAGVAYGPLLWNLQILGADLQVVQRYADECLEFSERYHLPFSAGLARATQAGWLDPMKKAEILPSMADTIAEWEQSNHIAHRVKNNLQIIYSMLNLQMPHFKDAGAIELFKESRNRVYTMALIHEKLYQSQSLAHIDLAEYVNSLITNLFISYGMPEETVKSKISIQDVNLDLDKVIPVALIINELVSNALKHGYPEQTSRKDTGEIHVELHRDPKRGLRLTVSDNGVGFPETVEMEQPRTLGLKLVRVLTTQLNGDMKLRVGDGTEFSITFAV